MVTITREDLPRCLIRIDKEGRWFHEGREMIHRGFIRLFYEHMELDEQGRTVIRWQGQRCVVDVEDTAFVVRRADVEPDRVRVLLSDDTLETLRLDTLHVGEGYVLYGRVKEERFPARFTRPAYYQLAAHVEEIEGRYVLRLASGEAHPLEAGRAGLTPTGS